MPGPVRQSNVVQQGNIAPAAVTAAAINGVVAGNCLIAIVVANSPTSSSADLVSAYGTTIGGSPANTWTLIARSKLLDSAGTWCVEVTAWIAHNVAAGNTEGKPTLVPASANYVWHHMDEWPGIVTASAVDKTATATAASTATSITVGPTAALAQTNEVVIAAVGTRLAYTWNGSGSGAGTKPASMDAILRGTTDNSIAATGQSSYKDPAGATTGVSATWTYANAQTAVAIIFTIKQGTTNLRLEVDDIDSADITGTTGWTFGAWAGDPFSTLCNKKWSAYSASIVSGKLVFPDAPAGATAGATYNVSGHQEAGTKTTGWMVGTVRSF